MDWCSIMLEKEQLSPQHALRAEVYYWVALVKSGTCSEEQLKAFNAWLAQNPEHRALYREVSDTWSRVGDFMPAIAAEIDEARRFTAGRRKFSLAIVAAAAIILAVGLSFYPGPSEIEFYHTAKGEQKELALSDGSSALLNTDTRVQVEYSRHARTVHIERGEALFTVSNLDERPFDVVTRDGRIRDISTRFSVRTDDERTSVVVVDGAVIVMAQGHAYPQPVSAGEKITFPPLGASWVEKVDAQAMTAWSDKLLVFQSKPLQEVMTELTRYHDVNILIRSNELRKMRMSGVFETDDLQGLLRAVEAALPVSIERNDRVIFIDQVTP